VGNKDEHYIDEHYIMGLEFDIDSLKRRVQNLEMEQPFLRYCIKCKHETLMKPYSNRGEMAIYCTNCGGVFTSKTIDVEVTPKEANPSK
jgi:ribosomal protein L37AE/L43A